MISWLRCDLKCLRTRLLVWSIRIAPNKPRFIDLLSRPLGLIAAIANPRRRRGVHAFAKATGTMGSPRRYALKYFREQARRDIWSAVVYDAWEVLAPHISLRNDEMVRSAAAAGRGVMLVGAHYGPSCYTFVSRQYGLDVRPLVDKANYEALLGETDRCSRFLVTKKLLFYRNELRPFLAARAEKSFIEHLRAGGMVSVLNDYARADRGGPTTEFFGLPMRFNLFAFKAALKYQAPVFFYIFDALASGGFSLRFEPAGPFETAEDGAAAYAAFLQAGIGVDPFMWYPLPEFTQWFQAAEKLADAVPADSRLR